AQATVALGNISADMLGKLSSAASQVPPQVISAGSGFEASMSPVAATMGITSAAKEFEILSAAAKEMGETTKFSASQAGEALNYLALAGYDAEKAVSALPTVLNVAAAGGMELASASDMITDAMSALGLETSQMNTFSDQLAVTAQKSNTSISQLGEAILTVGGTAKTLSGGVVEMNTALGILADNGIKGSEGGTMLRNVILSLSAPTSTAAAALESLGVTAFDASGAMRPLQDTFADLDAALSTLSDQEKNAVLSEIFNKVDLKGVNALLGTSAERFDELSGYISDCAGAAAQMAETMDDNLKGDLTIMQSALEGLGIAAYEKFQEPFREAVQEVTGYIGDLTSSMTDGELSESVEKISQGFSELAASAIQFVGNNVIPMVVSGLEVVVDHAYELKNLIILIAAEFLALKAAAVLTPIVDGIMAANRAVTLYAAEMSIANLQQLALSGGMTASEIVVGLFTGKIKAATVATAAFNAVCAINPVVLVTTAIAALAVGIGIFVSQIDEATEETNEYTEALENARAASQNITDNSEKEIAVIQRKADRYEELRQRFATLTKNEMAEFLELAEELQGILPEGTKIIDEQSGAYLNLADSIEKVTEKMRLQAALSAKYEEYSVAAANYYDIKAKLADIDSFVADEKSKGINPDPGHDKYTDEKDYLNDLARRKYGLSYDELVATQQQNEQILQEYEELKEKTYDSIENSYDNDGINKSTQQMSDEEYARNRLGLPNDYTGLFETVANNVAETQAENTEKLKSGWESLNHAYAMGVISSEEELYARKSALLEQYGNADLQEHWKYYEELYDQQQEFAENSKKAAEDAAKEEADIRDQQWNNISRRAELGLLTAEEAYKEQLGWIQKYCPEYADEWYSYYKTIVDYQREAMREQVEGVRDSLSETISEYKEAYAELESSVNSYKNRLLSVGDLFSITTETDGNGNETTFYSVENLKKQMAEMQKYHDYVKRIKANGGSEALVSELTSMDFDDGLVFAENLAKAPKEEIEKISGLLAEREKLAEDLANELYAPEMEQLNSDLVNGVIAEFGTLPEDIREIGAAALEAFIAGLSETENLTEKVTDFTDSFFTACDEGISNGIAGLNLTDSLAAAFDEQDTYAIVKEKGDELVNG
ncbi:MAG: phage tail tape measure protein, partial [Oscillospiraceae bacterium]|nr:phage tail tape measure protein [Oscillospiraceae bacterium]